MKKLAEYFIWPIIFVLILDCCFTLIGQPGDYWQNFNAISESSPIGFFLLKINPILFIDAFIVYMVVIYVILRKIPQSAAIIVGLSLFLGHVWGSASWLPVIYHQYKFPRFEFYQWWLTISYFVIIAIASVILIRIRRDD